MTNRLLTPRFLTASAVLAVCFFLPISVHATSYTVSTTDDELDETSICTTGDSTDCSLREAITTANENTLGDHSIIVPAGTYTLSLSSVMLFVSTDGDDNTDGDLDITNTGSAITIQGEDMATTIIDGDGSTMQERVFEVLANVTAVFENMTIQNGRAGATGSLDGGAIYNSGLLTLNSVTVTDSTNDGTSDVFGAGIYSAADSTLTLQESVVSNNVSLHHAGGIYSEGNATITNSIITGNSASSSTSFVRGGGIFNNGTMTISGSEISANTVESTDNNAFGGGIFNFENSTLVMTNTTVSGNTSTGLADSSSDGNGGGVYVYDDTVNAQLTHVTVADNSAEFGGGIYGPMTLSGVIVADNTASTSDDDCNGAMISEGYNIVESVSSNCTGLPGENDFADTNPGLDAAMTSVAGPDYYAFIDPASSPAVNSIPVATCESVLGDAPTDQIGESRTGSCDIGAFEYQDATAPTMTITNDTDAYNLVECLGEYTEQSATATDDIDEDVGDTLETSGSVDTAVLGEYSIVYTADDLTLNQGTATRTVTVQDTTVPELTMIGESSVSVYLGNDYTDDGATATDACDDGSVTVDTDNPVDTSIAGDYTVTYTATDVSGNVGTATRTVTVLSALDDTRLVEELNKEDATLTVVFDDETSVSFEPFGDSPAYEYTLSSDGQRIVVTNGKYVRIFIAQNQVAQKKINGKNLKRKFTELKVKKLYNAKSYDGIMVVLAKKNGTAKVVHLRLTADAELKKFDSGTFAIVQRKPQTIKVNAAKHRFTTKVGSSSSEEKAKWQVTRKGKLKKITEI
jgi:hypothetical protein